MKLIKSSLMFLLILLFQVNCFAESINELKKTFIVTGASGELGGSAARLLAKDYNLILLGRDYDKLKKLQKELSISNPHYYEVFSLDYTNNTSKKSFEQYLNQINQSINGVLLITPRPAFHGKNSLQDESVWLEVLQSTFTGPLEVLKASLPHLSNPSQIVVVAGTTSVQVQPEYGPACVIRRMWTSYIKALSHQFGPQGISINALSPGVVLTNFHEERIRKASDDKGISYEEQMEAEVSKIPLRKHISKQDFAQTVKFLLTEQSGAVNGINLILDGGYTTSY